MNKVEKENQIFELVSFVNYLQAKLFVIDFFYVLGNLESVLFSVQ